MTIASPASLYIYVFTTANLLLDHTGVIKISDFGLSRVRPDPKKKENADRFMTGETGSYRFM